MVCSLSHLAWKKIRTDLATRLYTPPPLPHQAPIHPSSSASILPTGKPQRPFSHSTILHWLAPLEFRPLHPSIVNSPTDFSSCKVAVCISRRSYSPLLLSPKQTYAIDSYFSHSHLPTPPTLSVWSVILAPPPSLRNVARLCIETLRRRSCQRTCPTKTKNCMIKAVTSSGTIH